MTEPRTTTRNDGTRLARKLAAWLHDVQHFQRVAIEHRMRGAVSVEIYSADVFAKRTRAHTSYLGNLFILLCLASIPTTGLIILLTDLNPLAWMACHFFGCFVAFLIVDRYGYVFVYAECKDVAAGVSRNDVGILKANVDDVRNLHRGWKNLRVYLVSANRFEPNVLRLARAHGFRCYEETEDGFREAEPPLT